MIELSSLAFFLSILIRFNSRKTRMGLGSSFPNRTSGFGKPLRILALLCCRREWMELADEARRVRESFSNHTSELLRVESEINKLVVFIELHTSHRTSSKTIGRSGLRLFVSIV